MCNSASHLCIMLMLTIDDAFACSSNKHNSICLSDKSIDIGLNLICLLYQFGMRLQIAEYSEIDK